MTRKEIDNFLANTKVYVAGKSKEIQEKLFSLGYRWNNYSKNIVVCCHTEAPFLFIYENKLITKSSDMELFCSHENREITVEEILALEITEPTYKPFKDKDECWNEMHKHSDFGWIKNKFKNELIHINRIIESYCGEYVVTIGTDDFYNLTLQYMFTNYTFTDGTPFGIKKE